ncbi:MAG: type transport system ATP-binding protein [Pseudonocardiales bacterium]|nr:type transport system ATP-binding protein [Pseudonocardiales bacterium]
MMSSAVSAAGVGVRRGGRQILEGVDWQVGPGTVCGVVGPSGCGKTTLLRAVIGAQRFTGRLRVLDRAAGDAALRRKIGYVTQSASVYDDLSVAENLRYFARIVGVGAAEVNRVLDRVELRSLGSDLVGRLSGGQRSRVSLAVALLGSPELLVLDEPTVGQDPVLRQELWRLFNELAAHGITLLVSSHAMDEAARCDTLLLLRDGRVLSSGRSPGQLCEQTRTATVEEAFLALVSAPA